MTLIDYVVGTALKEAYTYVDELTEEQFTIFTDKVRLYSQFYSINVLQYRDINDEDIEQCKNIVHQIYKQYIK